MAGQAKARLVEGPICQLCGGALDIKETPRQSEGSSISYPHRDGELWDRDHKATPIWRVLRP